MPVSVIKTGKIIVSSTLPSSPLRAKIGLHEHSRRALRTTLAKFRGLEIKRSSGSRTEPRRHGGETIVTSASTVYALQSH